MAIAVDAAIRIGNKAPAFESLAESAAGHAQELDHYSYGDLASGPRNAGRPPDRASGRTALGRWCRRQEPGSLIGRGQPRECPDGSGPRRAEVVPVLEGIGQPANAAIRETRAPPTASCEQMALVAETRPALSLIAPR